MTTKGYSTRQSVASVTCEIWGERGFCEVLSATLFYFMEAVAHRLHQLRPAGRIVKQVILQVGIAVDDPDVAQHLVEHARRAAGAALFAQVEQGQPGLLAQQADDDLPVRQGGVVIGNLAKAYRHF